MTRLGSLNLFGPIFSKELRVSSRQRRNYALRCLYVLILTLLVMLIWYSTTRSLRYNPIYSVARMSQVGVELLCTVGFFQFLALQLISPILISTAISDEINHGTLGTLMMTPITSLQIVTGKLFSRLLIMLLLLGTSLPILAIIRVFGGIEWRLVLAMVGLTLCSAIFAAAVSLLFSIFHRKAYAAILMTYMTLLALYLLIPLILTYSLHNDLHMNFFSYFNPFFSMRIILVQTQRPGVLPMRGWLHPLLQCTVLLAATLVLVLICSIIVRRVALRMAAGEAVIQPGKISRNSNDASADFDPRDDLHFSRPVSDHPVLWRELHTPVLSTPLRRTILIGFTFAALVWTYSHTWRGINDEETHMLYTFTFMLVTFITAAVLPATTITTEKEASTWESLLATPLTAREIVWGKTLGSLKKILPVSALFFGHVFLFTLAGIIHPLALVHMVFLLAGPAFFLVATGIKISSRVKHTTTAVMLNLGLGLFLWGIFPLLARLVVDAFRFAIGRSALADATLLLNPFFLNLTCFDELAHHASEKTLIQLRFLFPGHSLGDGFSYTSILCAISLGYAVAGIIALGSAIRCIRNSNS